jgi:hypothetical protein
MSERIGLLLSVLVFCTPSCIGTETDNPVAGFEPTACKREGGSGLRLPGVMSTSEALTLDSRDYDGLYCFAWEARASGRMHLSVFNMTGGCHIDWELGPSRIDANGLRLRVRNDECAVAACGTCAYDLSFEVEDVDATAPLPLSLTQLDCDDEPTRDATTLTLPIDERSEGVLCREGSLTSLDIACGGPHFPPCAAGSGSLNRCTDDGANCGDGGVCDPRPDAPFDMCLRQCEADADCPLPVETCVAGGCRLRETF